jgi:autotransporter-associated beta strand protein
METLGTFTNNGGDFSTGEGGQLIGTGSTVTWAGGTNTINNNGLVADHHWIISGGTNLVKEGPQGGTLQVSAPTGSPTGLNFTGTGAPGITLEAATTGSRVAGKILLQNDVTVDATLTGTASITSTSATNSGFIDLASGTRTFTVNNGSAATDMLVSAVITNGGLTKAGAGTLELSGANDYAGGTTVSAGTLVLANNSAAGSASGEIAVSGASSILQISSGTTIGNDITVSNATASVIRKVAINDGLITPGADDYTVGTAGTLKSSFGDVARDTTAKILAGTNSSTTTAATLSMNFSASAPLGTTNDSIRRSDVFSINGTTGSDLYVLQLSASGLAADSVLGYHNGTIWDLAINGNSGTNTTNTSYMNYQGAFSAFQIFANSLNLADYQGAYGIDTATNNVWAVVNYGGRFAAVPEPTSAFVGLLIGAGLLRRRRVA